MIVLLLGDEHKKRLKHMLIESIADAMLTNSQVAVSQLVNSMFDCRSLFQEKQHKGQLQRDIIEWILKLHKKSKNESLHIVKESATVRSGGGS